MALSHTELVREALANLILTNIGASGFLSLETDGGGQIVAELPLSAVAGVVTGPNLVFNAITPESDALGGIVAEFAFQNSAHVDVFRGSVTAHGLGGNITMSSVTIGVGEVVEIDGFTYIASL